MSTIQRPVADPAAPVGSRSWAAALLQEFGTKFGTDYFNRQLSFEEASAEFRDRQPRKPKGFAVRFARLGAGNSVTSARPERREAPKGFAAKLRFAGEDQD